ncbi:MAG: membrane protein insertase YidC [Chloroflexi bacterium]|nr:membrane protein insertase YidC [Chloroflexota bacterium]
MDFLAPIWNTFIFNPMVNLLLWIYTVVGNYGIAIILFTLLIRLITLPFYAQQQKAMKKQQALLQGKEYKEMQKKYAKDKEKLAQEQMKLYRANGVNPLGGCLPALIPWPVLIALYQSITMVMGAQPEQLMELAKHLYPFAPNLAAAVPVRPDFFGLNLASQPDLSVPITLLIPALVLLSTWVQQKMTVAPAADPSMTQTNQSMQMMMTVMVGMFSLQFPIGLSLYWIVFGIVGIVQQYFTNGGNLFGAKTQLAPVAANVNKGKKDVGRKS